MRILGLDPSISSTGWGIIEMNGNRLSYVADGFIPTSAKDTLSNRLHSIYTELRHIIELYKPDEASNEITYLKTNKNKNALTGGGKPDNKKGHTLLKILLPGGQPKNNDSSDALAIAITHCNLRNSYKDHTV